MQLQSTSEGLIPAFFDKIFWAFEMSRLRFICRRGSHDFIVIETKKLGLIQHSPITS